MNKSDLSQNTKREIESFAKYKFNKLNGPQDNKKDFKNPIVEKIRNAIKKNNIENIKKSKNKKSPEGIAEIVEDEVIKLMKEGKNESEALKYVMDNFDKISNENDDSNNDTKNITNSISPSPYTSSFDKDFDYKKALEKLNKIDPLLHELSPFADPSKLSKTNYSSYFDSLLNTPSSILSSNKKNIDSTSFKKEWYDKNGESVGLFYAAFIMLGLTFGSLLGYLTNYTPLNAAIGILIGFSVGIGLGLLTNALLITFKK
ncbi:MAG: hypothetical protein LBJ09_01880 [Clostridiales bacterium]|nr:hypothetical protein [Clostridiales bacterium]